jgi:hypothetical protein
VGLDQVLDHGPLALADARHVRSRRPGPQAELAGVPEELCDFGAVNHILAGQAGDVGAGAADQPALDHRGAPTGPRQIPRDELACRPATQN